MREILFRGKRKDNGEWIYGSLLKVKIGGNIAYLIFGEKFSFDGKNVEALTHALIDPETVGQYTGLTDKNGKKIFEGDICTDEHSIYKIVWCEDMHSWHCEVLKAECAFIGKQMLFPLWYWDNCVENGNRQLEVIGNIHDNPELLGGVGNG